MSGGIVYFASCEVCNPGDDWIRFSSKKKRDGWTMKHAETTGHSVYEGEQYEAML
jgi:hypothetical protein